MGSDAPQTIYATYMTYIRNMSENAMPLPYEVQEMRTPGSTAQPGRTSSAKPTRTLPRAASGGSRTMMISWSTWKPWTMRQEGEIPDHRGV